MLADMPVIPLFVGVTQTIHSADAEGVVVEASGGVDAAALREAG